MKRDTYDQIDARVPMVRTISREELPGKSSQTLPENKNLWRMRRAPSVMDHAQNATFLSGRASSVDPVRLCATCARTKMYD